MSRFLHLLDLECFYKILTFNGSNLSISNDYFLRNSETEVWNGDWAKKLSNEIQIIGRRKLRMLNNSVNIADLRIPPSNRLEKVSRALKKLPQYKNKMINGALFLDGNASDVEIMDYH